MGFWTKLFSGGSGVDDSVRIIGGGGHFVDSDAGVSITLPDDWRRHSLVSEFEAEGGRCRIRKAAERHVERFNWSAESRREPSKERTNRLG